MQRVQLKESHGMTVAEKQAMVKKAVREQRRERSGKEYDEEGSAAFHLILCLGFLNAISWILPLFMLGWHDKAFVSVGAKLYRISTSLTKFNISVECGKNVVEDQLCRLLNKTAGIHSLRDAMDYSCVLSQGAHARAVGFPAGPMLCQMMSMEFYASLIPMVLFPVTTFIYLMGVFYLYYYWEISHKRSHRTIGTSCITGAPVAGFIGFGAFTLVAPDLTELPLALTGGASSPLGMLFNAAGGDPTGLGSEVGQVDFGRAWFFTIMCLVWSGITMGFLFTFLQPRPDEIIDESLEKQAEEDAHRKAYEQRTAQEESWQFDQSHPDPPSAMQYSAAVVGSDAWGAPGGGYGGGDASGYGAWGAAPGGGWGSAPLVPAPGGQTDFQAGNQWGTTNEPLPGGVPYR